MHHWFVTSSIQTFIAHLKKKQRIYWNVNLYIDSLKSSSWRLYFLSPPTCCEHYKCRWNWMVVPTRLWFHRLNSSSDLVSYRCIPYHFLVVVFPIIKYSKIKQSKGKVFFCETCLKERAEGWKWALYHCQSISPSVALLFETKEPLGLFIAVTVTWISSIVIVSSFPILILVINVNLHLLTVSVFGTDAAGRDKRTES